MIETCILLMPWSASLPIYIDSSFSSRNRTHALVSTCVLLHEERRCRSTVVLAFHIWISITLETETVLYRFNEQNTNI